MDGALRTYRNPRFGWTIDYPATLRLGAFDDFSQWFGVDGIRLTNFVPDLSLPSRGAPSAGWLRAFPARGVALQIWFLDSLPGPPPLQDDRLPLDLGTFETSRRYVGGSEPRPLYRSFDANGTPFNISIWFGSGATSSDRAAIEAIVRSLRFPSLQPWTLWRDWYYVLGTASDYPVGSVTEIPASRLPVPTGFSRSEGIYLIHAPGGFYALPLVARLQDLPTCPVRFDRHHLRFSCRALDLRWDRYGRAIDPPPSYMVTDIGPHPVGVTLHEQVIYCPFFGALAPTNLWR